MIIEPDTSLHDSNEPAGDLAGRLDALAHLFAAPLFDTDRLVEAGMPSDLPALGEDELAAEHYRILSHDLVPDAGVFLEEDGMLGGPLARHLHERMAEGGYAPKDTTHSSGHVVNELGYLSHLLQSGRATQAGAFWRDHAAGWMPLVVLHLQHSGSAHFEALARAFDGALDRVQTLPVGNSRTNSTLPDSLPEAGLDLDEPRVGLARFGGYLAVPARSGLVLSRSSLSRLGRTFRLPTGFGSRSRIVEGLLRSAAQYDAWETVCDALLAECDAVEACWTSLEESPIWRDNWMQRLELTRSILQQMRSAEEMLTNASE